MLTVSHHHGTNPAISSSCKPSSSESGCFSQQHKQSVDSTSCKKIPRDQNSSNSWISNKEIVALNSESPLDGISMYPLISKSFETARYFRHYSYLALLLLIVGLVLTFLAILSRRSCQNEWNHTTYTHHILNMELGGILLAMTFFQLLDLDGRIPSSTACNKEQQTQNSDRNHICNSSWNNHKKRLKWPLHSSCINQFVGLFRAGDQVLVLMQRMIMYVSMKPKNLIEWAGPEASQILGGPLVGCGFSQALPIPYGRGINQTWWELQGSRGGTVELAGKDDSALLCWFCHPPVNQQKWPVMPFQAYWSWHN